MLLTRGIPTFFGCLSLDVPTAKFNLYKLCFISAFHSFPFLCLLKC